jgi:hypothetical protein
VASERLDILIKAIDQASATLTVVANNLDELTQAQRRQQRAQEETKQSSSGMVGVFGQVGAAIVTVNQALDLAARAWHFLSRAVSTAVSIIQPALEQAIEQEDVDRKLAVALRNLGGATTDSVASLRAYSDALEGVTGFSNEAIQGVQATLVAIGSLSGPTLTRATDAVVDFAAHTGRDLPQVALLIARAANGATEQLGRLGIMLPEGAEKAEKFGLALDALEGKVGGAAAALGQTFSGQVRILSEAFGDFQKAMGETITRSPEVRAFIVDLTALLGRLEVAVRSVGFSDFVATAVADIALLTEMVGRLGVGLSNLGAALTFGEMDAKARESAEMFQALADAAKDTRTHIEAVGKAGATLKGLEEISIADRSGWAVARIQELRKELGLVSTATEDLTEKAHRLRTLEALPGSFKTGPTRAEIAALRTEVMTLAPALDATGGAFTGLDDDANTLKDTLDKLGPAFGRLLDIQEVSGARAVLAAMVADLEKLGDVEPLELLASLDVKAPDIAKSAEAALSRVNARALVEILAKAGDEGSLRILASMQTVAPDIAAAAGEALAKGVGEGAKAAAAALEKLGPAFRALFEVKDAGASLQTVFAALVAAARKSGDETRLALFQAIAPLGSDIAAQIEGALSSVEADDLIQTLVDASDFVTLKFIANAEKIPEALRDAAERGLLELQNIDIAKAGENFIRFEWDETALLEMGAALTGMTEEMENQLILQGEAVLGQEEFWALVEASFAATTNLSDAMQMVTEGVDAATAGLKKTELVQGIILDLQTGIANSMAQMGGALVAAALGAEKSFLKAAGKILEQLAMMIVQALIFRAIMSTFGGGLLFSGGGQVPNTAVNHPPGFAAKGGQVQSAPAWVTRAPGAQAGGQIIGTRTGRDTVPVMLSPGEVVVRNDVVKFVEEAVLAQSAQGSTTPGFSFNLFFNNVIRRDTVEELMIEMTHLVENKGAVLTSSNVFD